MTATISETRDDTRRQPPPVTVHAWLWIIFGLTCLILGGFKFWQNEQRGAGWRAHARQRALLDRAGMPISNRIETLMRQRPRPAPEKAERHLREAFPRLNGGKPFNSGGIKGGEHMRFVDPVSRFHFDLYFRDGRLTGYSWGRWNREGPAPPGKAFGWDLMESLRRMVARIGPIVWVILAPIAVLLRRYRKLLAEVLLAAAIVCALAWLLAPNYSLTIKGITSNDNLFWGVMMLLASAAVLAWAHRKPKQTDEPLCPVCEYNLTGNVSGICPECGTPIAEELWSKVAIRSDRPGEAHT